MDEPNVSRSEINHEKFSIIALFHYNRIQQTKNISQSLMSLFVTTTRSFDYDAETKGKDAKKKAAVQEKHLLLKVEQHFGFVETEHGALGENVWHEAPWKRNTREKRHKI